MSKTVVLSQEVYDKAAEIAAKSDVSVEDFVSALIVQALRDHEYIASRAKLFNRDEFERSLNQIPDVEPEDYDRL